MKLNISLILLAILTVFIGTTCFGLDFTNQIKFPVDGVAIETVDSGTAKAVVYADPKKLETLCTEYDPKLLKSLSEIGNEISDIRGEYIKKSLSGFGTIECTISLWKQVIIKREIDIVGVDIRDVDSDVSTTRVFAKPDVLFDRCNQETNSIQASYGLHGYKLLKIVGRYSKKVPALNGTLACEFYGIRP